MAADGTIRIDTQIDAAGLAYGLSKLADMATGLLKDAISIGSGFQSAFAGVIKTVDATDDELAGLRQSIREMAKEMPASANSIAEVAEAAGQLGIDTPNIIAFTRVMTNLGVATNMSATEAATALARFANITGMSQDKFDKLGSTIVALGNNFATTEAEIVDMALRLAGTGAQVGMSEAQIMGLAAAMSSVGLQADAGGSAISRVLTMMQLACVNGGDALELIAKTAGMTADQFKQAFEQDAASALVAFIQGLNNAGESGTSAIAIIAELGDASQLSAMDNIMVRDALLRTAGASDLMVAALGLANTAWGENSALTEEAAKRYGTFDSQLQIMSNSAKDLAISIFDNVEAPLLQAIQTITDALQSADMQGYVTQISDVLAGLLQSVIERLPEILDRVASAIVWIIDNIDLLIGVIKVIIGLWAAIKAWNLTAMISGVVIKIIALGASLVSLVTAQGLAAAAQAALNAVLTANPIGVVVVAVAALVAGLVGLFTWLGNVGNNTEFDKQIKANAEAVTAFNDAVKNTSPLLVDANKLLSSTGRTIDQVSSEITEVENAITGILSSALAERRTLREDELDSIAQYNEELLRLYEEQMEVYRSRQIAELRKLEAEKGSITQEGIAQRLANAEAAYEASNAQAEDAYTAEIVLIENKYNALEQIGSEAYYQELRDAQAHYQETLSINQNYYDDTVSAATEASAELVLVDRDKWLKLGASRDKSKNEFKAALAQISLDEANAFLTMYLTAKEQGVAIGRETEMLASYMLACFDDLPRGMRDAGLNGMLGLIKGLEDEIPALQNAADMSAEEIVAAIRDYLAIQSPSKVMEVIGNQTIAGLIAGMNGMEATAKSGLSSFITDMVNSVRNQLGITNSKASVFATIGSSIVAGVYDGIEQNRSSFTSKVNGFFAGIVGSVRSHLGIASPSKLFRDAIGKNIGLGVIAGVESTEAALEKTIMSMFDKSTLSSYSAKISATVASGTRNNVKNLVESRVSAIIPNGDKTSMPTAREIAKAIWDAAPDRAVYMDGEKVGEVVEPRVSKIQGDKSIAVNRRNGLAYI